MLNLVVSVSLFVALFGMANTSFHCLDDVKAAIQSYQQLWTAVNWFFAQHEMWSRDPSTFDAEVSGHARVCALTVIPLLIT